MFGCAADVEAGEQCDGGEGCTPECVVDIATGGSSRWVVFEGVTELTLMAAGGMGATVPPAAGSGDSGRPVPCFGSFSFVWLAEDGSGTLLLAAHGGAAAAVHAQTAS